ncbi:hypothetical protein sphantq_04412 (plasmid) [Sphingobium sp. AntQ-1]|nr:hypothetical protein sphantq_04412 [Sphingobium sp. AntQ-1]
MSGRFGAMLPEPVCYDISKLVTIISRSLEIMTAVQFDHALVIGAQRIKDRVPMARETTSIMVGHDD